MEVYQKTLQVRWADLDINGHIRHSVYYDWGSFIRIHFLAEHGLDMATMQSLQFGPVIFREECVFKKEIKLEDAIQMNMTLLKARKDMSRWSIRHTIFKEGASIAAILHLEGAWMDTVKRKLMMPPQSIITVYNQIPKDPDFEWMPG